MSCLSADVGAASAATAATAAAATAHAHSAATAGAHAAATAAHAHSTAAAATHGGAMRATACPFHATAAASPRLPERAAPPAAALWPPPATARFAGTLALTAALGGHLVAGALSAFAVAALANDRLGLYLRLGRCLGPCRHPDRCRLALACALADSPDLCRHLGRGPDRPARREHGSLGSARRTSVPPRCCGRAHCRDGSHCDSSCRRRCWCG